MAWTAVSSVPSAVGVAADEGIITRTRHRPPNREPFVPSIRHHAVCCCFWQRTPQQPMMTSSIVTLKKHACASMSAEQTQHAAVSFLLVRTKSFRNNLGTIPRPIAVEMLNWPAQSRAWDAKSAPTTKQNYHNRKANILGPGSGANNFCLCGPVCAEYPRADYVSFCMRSAQHKPVCPPDPEIDPIFGETANMNWYRNVGGETDFRSTPGIPNEISTDLPISKQHDFLIPLTNSSSKKNSPASTLPEGSSHKI